ncbi:dihydrofolate reductase [Fragilaria crotonensis]|nr:dihydrofolate reductase [Fragilaria crotonensis]
MTRLLLSRRVWRTTTGSSLSRSFSVKEISWCKSSSRPSNGSTPAVTTAGTRTRSDTLLHDSTPTTGNDQNLWDPIERFGIVAAMSKNRVIGIHGKLPWNVPNDRQHFKNLTRDKVIIVGRKTYHDTPEERNIAHVRHCIVVSTTASDHMGSEKVQVVRSFSEAIHLAKQLELTTDEESLDCWVCGGERLYLEALHHKSAQEVHLTVVDAVVEVVPLANGQTPEVALFPAKYRWDRFFDEESRRSVIGDGTDVPDCIFIVYGRKKR